MPPLLPGTLVAGKYKIERVVGQGGMGIVLAARHEELQQLVAIKLLRPEIDRDDTAGRRFLREARAAARIQSDHVVRVFDVGTLESGHAYMVMEHLEGADLQAVLAERGPLPIDEAVSHVLEALEAMAHAHAHGIIHRDLKPANLFLARRADGSQRIKVLDFGISKAAPSPDQAATPGTLTAADAILGSPAYMSPEQLRSSKNVDARSDIWSVGVILHELVTGELPFNGETVGAIFAAVLETSPAPLRARRSNAPAGLEAIVDRCLQRESDRRFPDVGALAAALAPFGSARTAGLPAQIGLVLQALAGAPPARGSLPSLPREETSAMATTAALPPLKPTVQMPEERPGAGAAIQTGAGWSRRPTDLRGSRRWLVPLSTLGLGLTVGLVVAWRATQAPVVAQPGSSAAQAVSIAPAPVLSLPASQEPPAESAVVPMVVPAPPSIEVKPAESAAVASSARPSPVGEIPRVGSRPAASAKPAAKAPAVTKSPAELMRDRD